MTPAGQPPEPAPLDELDAALDKSTQNPRDAKLQARRGIEHFVQWAREFLVNDPPQSQVMLSQGFGVQLASGAIVCLTPPVYQDMGTQMDSGPAFYVTEGRSIRGQGGVQDTNSIAVTGGQPEPSRQLVRVRDA